MDDNKNSLFGKIIINDTVSDTFGGSSRSMPRFCNGVEDGYADKEVYSQKWCEIEKGDFWRILETILAENGNPFEIIHEKGGKQTYWACVNKLRAFTDNAVSLDLVQQRGHFCRVGLYVRNRNTSVGQVILDNWQEIDRQLPFEHIWQDGSSNPKTLRVITKFHLNGKTPRLLIETALPYILKYIEIAKIYGPRDFFDF